MVFCKRCEGDVEAQVIEPSGIVVCTGCGHVLDQHSWSQEPTFTKEGGESTVAGHFVSNNAGSHGMGRIANGRIYGMQLDATEKAGGRAKIEIERIVDLLQIHPRDDVINSAHRFYMLAVTHNFTKGRRTAQIAAATIYIICRQEDHPFMLLDFADVLQVNVFHLGSVFLQLCRLFRLEEHAIVTKPVDPSLYIHRFADRLKFGSDMRKVADTALRLMRSMKQNWLQTGRRPSGLCGAALYIAGHMHGFPVSKQDVIRVVHVGETTLDKRVSEFNTTDEASLTAAEFRDHIRKEEEEEALRLQALDHLAALPAPEGSANHGCSHVKQGALLFCDGMCRECYTDYIKVVGGHDNRGHHPPSFKSAADGAATMAIEHEERMALPEYAGQGAEDAEEGSVSSNGELEDEMDAALQEGLSVVAKAYLPAQALELRPRKPKQKRRKSDEADEAPKKRPRGRPPKALKASKTESASKSDTPASKQTAAGKRSESRRRAKALEASEQQEKEKALIMSNYIHTDDLEKPAETLSDLEDDEMDRYLNTAAETKLKDIVWTAMNQDYIEKQALKAALKPKTSAEPEEDRLAEKGVKRPRGRPKGSRSKTRPEDDLAPAASAADGVRKMLTAKKLSSKINYANLDNLFAGDQAEPSPKPAGKSAPAKLGPKTKARQATALTQATQPQANSAQQAGADEQSRQEPPSANKKKAEPKRVATPRPDAHEGKATATKLRSSALGSLKSSLPKLQRRTMLAPL